MNFAMLAVLLLTQSKHTYTQGDVLHPGGVPPTPRADAPIKPMGGYGQPTRHPGNKAANRAVVVPILVGVPVSEITPPPPPAEAPSVLLNPQFQPEVANPALQDYSNTPLIEASPLEQRQSQPPPASIDDQSPTIYLIAFKDGGIVASLGFWLDGNDTLVYITRDGIRNRVSMDRIDVPFSTKLNAERNLDFKPQ